jgi:pimeloyl-ACP methyl ester carboxylesterase
MDCAFVKQERGYDRWMLWLHGWGFCNDVFAWLDLPFNFIFVSSPVVGDISSHLNRFVCSNGLDSIAVAGWSLGGLVAWQAALSARFRLSHLVLVSVRNFYAKDEISNMKMALRKDRQGVMRRFYRMCLAGSPPGVTTGLRQKIEERCLGQWDAESLEKGLDMLHDYRIGEKEMPSCRVILCYGERDMLVPEERRLKLSDACSVVIHDAGHIPFLTPGFSRALAGLL